VNLVPTAFAVDGQPPVSRDAAPTAVYRVVTPDYLATMGIPLLRGRHFLPADRQDAPGVTIVNQTLARTFWGNEDPIGRRLQLLGPPMDVWLTMIGVAGDVKESLDPQYPLRLDARPTIYRPVAQEPVSAMTLVLRTGSNHLSPALDVRRQVAGVDPSIPVMMLQSVRQGLAESLATPRFNTMLLLGFAALALLLTAVGDWAGLDQLQTVAVSLRWQVLCRRRDHSCRAKRRRPLRDSVRGRWRPATRHSNSAPSRR
jgi:hypothetical protein